MSSVEPEFPEAAALAASTAGRAEQRPMWPVDLGPPEVVIAIAYLQG